MPIGDRAWRPLVAFPFLVFGCGLTWFALLAGCSTNDGPDGAGFSDSDGPDVRADRSSDASSGTSGSAGGSGNAGGAGGKGAGGGSVGGTAGTAGAAGGNAGAGGSTDDAGDSGLPDGGPPPLPPPWSTGIPVPPSPQKPGDARAGYEYLTTAGYFGCGIPSRFYAVVGPLAARPGAGAEPLPGRTTTVNGAPLPYMWNQTKNVDGIDVVYMNCLQCHAGKFNGQLVIGLGNADADWTTNLGGASSAAILLRALLPTAEEQREIDMFFGRLDVIGPTAVMRTVGTNPAEMLATTFISHRDKKTLAWSDVALLQIPVLTRRPAGDTVTSKVPPWWRMSKKSGQFYNAMGRGDHRRSEMLAGSLCTDSVEQANAIDAHFNDVNAYIASVRAPVYPFTIDRALAEQGRTVFRGTCAGCHGTYPPDAVSYPDLLIPQSTIQTDDVVSMAGTTKDYGSDLVDWYNQSWYGEVGRYAPYNGYVAPPLDGIWATAPYLHNGSVPDVETLLDSGKRPRYWRRVDHDTTHYDENTLGFPWQALASGQSLPPFGVAANNIYDTDQYSHSNRGHTFGDVLTKTERRAIIEYLKTL
jgi:cytochrome c5